MIMKARTFLAFGIDNFADGGISSLNSCRADASVIAGYFEHKLHYPHVPPPFFDEQATRDACLKTIVNERRSLEK